MSSWKRLSGKVVYQNRWMSLHEDQVLTPDGRSTIYGWVETPPAVFIVAINEHEQVCLVEQERYTTGLLSWELPAGSTDGQDEEAAAKRELAEEAGLHADHWERLRGELQPFNAFSPERNIIYIATGLHEVRGDAPKGDEVITGVRWVGWPELKTMMKSAELTDGQTISALALAGLHLGQLK